MLWFLWSYRKWQVKWSERSSRNIIWQECASSDWAEPLGYFVVRSVGNPYLVSVTPCDREIFGTDWIRKSKRFEKTYRRRKNMRFLDCRILRRAWRSEASESTPVFYRLLILNTFPIIRTTHFTFIIYLLYFVHFHFSFNRHTVRARLPVYVLTDFTTLLLARVSTLQLLKTLRNLCFPYVLIYDSLCSFGLHFIL